MKNFLILLALLIATPAIAQNYPTLEQYSDRATTIATSIDSDDTTLVVTDGSVFPALAGGQFFYATFNDLASSEYVIVTARSGNTLTISRAALGTTAIAHSDGTGVLARNTKPQSLTNLRDGAAAAATSISAGAGLSGGGTLADDFTIDVVFGDGSGEVCEGDDPRLSDARVPTGAAGGSLSGTYPSPSLAAGSVGSAQIFDGAISSADLSSALIEPAAATPGLRTIGSGALQCVAGNDSRLSDSRPPSGSAGGGLGGTYPNPSVNGMTGGVLTNDTAHGDRGGGSLHAAASGSAAGFLSSADYSRVQRFGSQPIVFGLAGLGVGGVTRYLSPGTGAALLTVELAIALPYAGTIGGFRCRALTGPGALSTDTFTVRIDGADSALSFTMTGAGVQSGSDGDSASVAADDLLSISVASGALSTLADVVCQVAYVN